MIFFEFASDSLFYSERLPVTKTYSEFTESFATIDMRNSPFVSKVGLAHTIFRFFSEISFSLWFRLLASFLFSRTRTTLIK